MRDRLIIRWPYRPDQEPSWVLTDAQGRIQGSVYRGDWGQCAAAVGGRQLVVLVPAADVLMTRVSVPTRNRARLLQAVPFALEDQLAEDVATLHFALGPELEDGNIAVAVVARERMASWIETLQSVGMRPDLLVPEVLTLPWEEGNWSLLVEGDDALIRYDLVQGGYAETAFLSLMLDVALKEAGDQPPRYLQVAKVGRSALENNLDGVETVYRDAATALEVMATGLAEIPPVDLLQGAYSRSEQLGRLWRPWRAAAILAAAWVVLEAGVAGYDIWRLKGEINAQEQQITQLFRSALPDAQRIVDPRAQMEQKLRELRGGGQSGGALALLAGVSEVLQGESSVRLNAASYRGGRLDLDLELNDIQALDRIKQQASQRTQSEAEIVSASTQGDKVAGRLRLGGGS